VWRALKKTPPSPRGFFEFAKKAGTPVSCKPDQVIFLEGDAAGCVYYIQKGTVKLSVVSAHGKEAVVTILGPSDVLGEGCIAGQLLRLTTATAFSVADLLRIQKVVLMRELHRSHLLSDDFISYLIGRNVRVEEALIDQLFNSTEKRLARALLLLARYRKKGKPEAVIPRVSQTMLAEMIGTSRPRVSIFMNKFRKLGFVNYNYNGDLQVNSPLLNVVLHD